MNYNLMINFNVDACIQAKQTLRKYNDIFDKYYRLEIVIGNCMELATEYNGCDYEGFLQFYCSTSNRNCNQRHKGLSEQQIIDLAHKFQDKCYELRGAEAKQYDISLYLNKLLCHIVVESLFARNKEYEIKTSFEHFNYKVIHSDRDEDILMGIDLKVYDKDGVLKCLIQVKPHTFFIGNCEKNKMMLQDRLDIFEKEKKGNEKFPNVPYFYMIYNTNNGNWIKNAKTDTFRFKISDLITETGMAKLCMRDILSNQYKTFF